MSGARKDPTIDELQQALQREHTKLRALQDIGQALSSTLELEELVALLLDRVTRIMDSESATLYVLDDDGDTLWSRVEHAGTRHEIRLRVGQGLAGWVAKAGRALNVKDAYQDVRFDGEWDRRTGFRTTSTLCVPVKNHQGKTTGVLQVLNKRAGYFGVDDEGMLAALASQAAVSLENSKLFISVVGKNMELLETQERLQTKVRELDVLFEIAQVSASATRLEDLLEGVLARTMHAIDAEAGSILLPEAGSGDLRFCCAVGGVPDAIRRLKVGRNEGICSWVARTGEAQVVNDVDRDQRHLVTIADSVGYHPRSVLCVPLRLDDDGRGALELLNKSHGHGVFTDDDLKLASVIAGHVSTAIRLAQARERRTHEERLSTIGQALSGVVHDLRGPLSVVKGYAKLLRDEPAPERRATLAESIVRQVDAVNAMAAEVLAFARGDATLLVRKVYLQGFFGELVEHLRAELADDAVSVELELSDRGVAHFDEDKVRRAVHNLARNARQAIGDRSSGHIVLRVSRRAADGALLVRCVDDGPGVPAEIRDHMFDSFTTHGKAEGSGLGLAIVQKVALDHGGTIEMNRSDGKTVFTLALPQPRAPERVEPREASQEVTA